MRLAANKTVPATLELTSPARLDFTRVIHTQKGVGLEEHSGNPSAQHPITMSSFNQHNQHSTNNIQILRELEEADPRYLYCTEVSRNADPVGKVSYA
jgi:nicotinamidase-related amidase